LTSAKEILAIAEAKLAQAEIVRMAAIKAVELAQEAVKLEAAGVASKLLITAAEEAAQAIRIAEKAALLAWENAAVENFDRIRNRRKNDVSSQ
jgi:hypothetical protein